MIYATAETAQDVANYLRGTGEVAKKIVAEMVADRLLGRKSPKGIVITAPRQSGKTTELLKYAEEKYPGSKFCIVSMNYEVQRNIIKAHRDLFSEEVTPPLMLTPDVMHLFRGRNWPILVDEFNSLNSETQDTILNSGFFVAAVTS